MDSNQTKLETMSYILLIEWDDEKPSPDGFPTKVTLSRKNRDGEIFGKREYFSHQPENNVGEEK